MRLPRVLRTLAMTPGSVAFWKAKQSFVLFYHIMKKVAMRALILSSDFLLFPSWFRAFFEYAQG